MIHKTASLSLSLSLSAVESGIMALRRAWACLLVWARCFAVQCSVLVLMWQDSSRGQAGNAWLVPLSRQPPPPPPYSSSAGTRPLNKSSGEDTSSGSATPGGWVVSTSISPGGERGNLRRRRDRGGYRDDGWMGKCRERGEEGHRWWWMGSRHLRWNVFLLHTF